MPDQARPNQSLQKRLKDQLIQEREKVQKVSQDRDKRRAQDTTAAAKAAAALLFGKPQQNPSPSLSPKYNQNDNVSQPSSTVSPMPIPAKKRASANSPSPLISSYSSVKPRSTGSTDEIAKQSNSDILAAATRAAASIESSNNNGSLSSSSVQTGSVENSAFISSNTVGNIHQIPANGSLRLGSNGLPVIRSAPMAPPINAASTSAAAASSLAFKKKILQDKEDKEKRDREIRAQLQYQLLQDQLAQQASGTPSSPAVSNLGQSMLQIPHMHLSEPDTDLSDAASLISHDLVDKNNAMMAAKSSVKQRPLSGLSDAFKSDNNSEYEQQFISGAAKLAANKMSLDDYDRESTLSHLYVGAETLPTGRSPYELEKIQKEKNATAEKEKNALAAAMAAKSNVDDAVEKINNVIASKGGSKNAQLSPSRYQPTAIWSGFHHTTLRDRENTEDTVSKTRIDKLVPPPFYSGQNRVASSSSSNLQTRSPRPSTDLEEAHIGLENSPNDSDEFLAKAAEKQREFLLERQPDMVPSSKQKSKSKSKWGILSKIVGTSSSRDKPSKQVSMQEAEHVLRPTMRKDQKKSFNQDKPWKHHRNALLVTEKEKKRYEGLWAANKGLHVPFMYVAQLDDDYECSGDEGYNGVSRNIKPESDLQLSSKINVSEPDAQPARSILQYHLDGEEIAGDDVDIESLDEDEYEEYEYDEDEESDEEDDEEYYGDEASVYKEDVHGLVVRELWRRSRIPDNTLENIWNLVDHRKDGALDRDAFLVGMWLVDQSLYGRKLPTKVDAQLWNSVARLSLKIRVKGLGEKKQKKKQKRAIKKSKKQRKKEPPLIVLHPHHV